jgi:hypothetical protein
MYYCVPCHKRESGFTEEGRAPFEVKFDEKTETISPPSLWLNMCGYRWRSHHGPTNKPVEAGGREGAVFM